MPKADVPAAVIERYESFAIAATARIFFDEAPLKLLVGGAEVKVVPPYVVLQDDGTVPDYTVEYGHYERTDLRFEVYAPSLDQAAQIALAVMFNGGGQSATLGMNFAAALPLTGQDFKAMVWKRSQRFQEASRGGDAKPVFRIRMWYVVAAQRAG